GCFAPPCGRSPAGRASVSRPRPMAVGRNSLAEPSRPQMPVAEEEPQGEDGDGARVRGVEAHLPLFVDGELDRPALEPHPISGNGVVDSELAASTVEEVEA